MNATSYFKSYLKVFLILASPFLLLTFANLFIPINTSIMFDGYIFSFFASFLLVFQLREKRIHVSFNNRELYIDKLKSSLTSIGYFEETREGLLTTYNSDSYYPTRKIFAYIYKDSAIIHAPKKYIKALRNT